MCARVGGPGPVPGGDYSVGGTSGTPKNDKTKLEKSKIDSLKQTVGTKVSSSKPTPSKGLGSRTASFVSGPAHSISDRKEISKAFEKAGYKQTPGLEVEHVKTKNLRGETKVLGSGAINQVLKINVVDDTGMAKPMAFKAEDSFTDATIPDVMRSLGITPEKPLTLQRNMATYLLAERLFPGIIPKTEPGVINGELGTAMAIAPGIPGGGIYVETPLPKDHPSQKGLAQYIEYKKNGDIDEELFHSSIERLGIREKKADDGSTSYVLLERQYPNVDVDDPALKRKSTQLQIIDGLTKQGDRHLNNIYINVNNSGKTSSLQGIDNDQAYGTKRIPQDEYAADRFNNAVGYPVVVEDEDIQAVIGLDVNAVAQDMRDLGFPEEEINAHIDSIMEMQTHLLKVAKQNHGVQTDLPAESVKNSYYMQLKEAIEATQK